jgi:hypothetical protein
MVKSPIFGLDTKTYWLTVSRNVTLTNLAALKWDVWINRHQCTYVLSNRTVELKCDIGPENAFYFLQTRICVRALLSWHAGGHQGSESERQFRGGVQDRRLNVGCPRRRAQKCKYCILFIIVLHCFLIFKLYDVDIYMDRLWGLLVPGYRSTGPGSIPGATRCSEK